MSYIFNGYSKGDNKCIWSYDLKPEFKHIIYLDTNTLCSYGMFQFLPTSAFQLVMLKNYWLIFLIKTVCASLWELATLTESRIEAKKSTLRSRIQSIAMIKTYIEFNIQERIEAEKKWWQRYKSIVQLYEECYIWKNSGNGIDVKLNRCKCSKEEKRLFNMHNKTELLECIPAYIGRCILELSKILTYKFQYDCIEHIYDSKSKLLFTDSDSLMHGIKTGDVYEDFKRNKEMFDFSNYST